MVAGQHATVRHVFNESQARTTASNFRSSHSVNTRAGNISRYGGATPRGFQGGSTFNRGAYGRNFEYSRGAYGYSRGNGPIHGGLAPSRGEGARSIGGGGARSGGGEARSGGGGGGGGGGHSGGGGGGGHGGGRGNR